MTPTSTRKRPSVIWFDRLYREGVALLRLTALTIVTPSLMDSQPLSLWIAKDSRVEVIHPCFQPQYSAPCQR